MLASASSNVDYLRRLTQAGFDDVLVLSRDTAAEVLTKKRIELLNEIATTDVSSMRDLAQHVDRDISIVSRDLDVLYEADIIDYEQAGRSKRPVLAHENVMVEPIVFDGEVMSDEDVDAESELTAD